MKLINRAKKFVANTLHRRGYHLERIVEYGEYELDVFDLVLNTLGPKDPDFFVFQVGAHDGKSGDPIHGYIKKFGWKGLLMEPQPSVFSTLSNNYSSQPQLHLVNAAIGAAETTTSLFTVENSSYLASFDRQTLERRVKDTSAIVELHVNVHTFDSLSDKFGISRVDFLQIDTEGFDFEVIKLALQSAQFPHPSMIRYEHLHLSSADRESCISLLGQAGYRLFRDNRDTIAIDIKKLSPSGSAS